MKQPQQAQELSPQRRTENFDEVTLGYSKREALGESARCLQCKDPVCIKGCPVEIDIKKFIHAIVKEDYKQAYFTIKEKNDFPSICGRVCPAEYQCRKACVLAKKGSSFASDQAINIHFLERFAGDYGMKMGLESKRPEGSAFRASKKHKVAVVGSGPAGLCVAGELARSGIKVVIFESLHKAGGVLRYGIPPFRLPLDILEQEIEYLRKMGVEIILNTVIGNIITLDELFKQGFSSVFLGLGAGVPSFLGIPGENTCNIYSANEFLTRVNLMGAYKFPDFHTPINVGKSIIVIGGGNTAIDAARVGIRLQRLKGLEVNVTVLYRRTEVEMPARRLEIKHAQEEGIGFNFLVQPKEFISGDGGSLQGVKCFRCNLGEPDSSGRRRPVIIDGSEFIVDCDIAIVAVGLGANKLLTSRSKQLKVNKYGDLVVDSDTMATSMKGVYAGGDIVGGEGTVIEAMGMAKRAANAIRFSLGVLA